MTPHHYPRGFCLAKEDAEVFERFFEQVGVGRGIDRQLTREEVELGVADVAAAADGCKQILLAGSAMHFRVAGLAGEIVDGIGGGHGGGELLWVVICPAGGTRCASQGGWAGI